MHASIASYLVIACRAAPEQTFAKSIIENGDITRLEYREVALWVAETIVEFDRLGIRRGDVIACYLEAPLPTAIFYLSCAFAGVHPVPLSPLFSPKFLGNQILQQLGTNTVFTIRELAPMLVEHGMRTLYYGPGDVAGAHALPERGAGSLDRAIVNLADLASRISPSDLLMYQPTSGSTGYPKIARRAHVSVTRYADNLSDHIGEDNGPHRFLLIAALTHVYGVHIFTTALKMGAELCFTRAIDTAACIQEIRMLDPTFVPMMPRVLRSVFKQHVSLGGSTDDFVLSPSVRVFLSAGGFSDLELLRAFAKSGIDVMEMYGSSEASIVALTPRGGWREGWAGRVVPDAQVRLAPDGELLVKSPGVMEGYSGNAQLTQDAFTEDGFYRTGDFAQLEDGYLRIIGRKCDVFGTQEGSWIYPERIETDIEAIPGVQQVMLAGDGKPYLTALIVVKGEAEDRAEPDGWLSPEVAPEAYEAIGGAMAEINERLEKIERIVRFLIFTRPFDPKLYQQLAAGKIRRSRKEFFAAMTSRIQQLYDNTPRPDPTFVPRADRRIRPRVKC